MFLSLLILDEEEKSSSIFLEAHETLSLSLSCLRDAFFGRGHKEVNLLQSSRHFI